MGLSGVQRTMKFVKYLPTMGWKPTVLTVEPGGYYAFDPTLLQEVEEAGVEIIRTGSRDANRLLRRRKVVKVPSERLRKFLQFCGDLFFIPDTKIGWRRPALRAASALLKGQRFNLLFATAPPQTGFLIGLKLQKKYRVPLVVEYRDSWLDYPFKYFPTPLHRYLHYRLEKKVLRAAHKIVVTHRRIKEELVRRHRFLGYHDVAIIPQGFDPEDFPERKSEARGRVRKMRISHAGSFYGGRSPAAMLNALSDVFHEMPALRGRIELCLIGTVRNEDRSLVTKLGLQNDVLFTGYLEHRECTRLLLSSDVLWFVIDNDQQSPGKLYEYFGARKPILASVVPGYTEQLLRECRAATIVPLADRGAHRQALLDLFAAYQQKRLPRVSVEFAERFNRRFLTADLVKLFESLIDIDQHPIQKLNGRTL
jgi:glycosyltransferase involved in cell wall biosynthesis